MITEAGVWDDLIRRLAARIAGEVQAIALSEFQARLEVRQAGADRLLTDGVAVASERLQAELAGAVEDYRAALASDETVRQRQLEAASTVFQQRVEAQHERLLSAASQEVAELRERLLEAGAAAVQDLREELTATRRLLADLQAERHGLAAELAQASSEHAQMVERAYGVLAADVRQQVAQLAALGRATAVVLAADLLRETAVSVCNDLRLAGSDLAAQAAAAQALVGQLQHLVQMDAGGFPFRLQSTETRRVLIESAESAIVVASRARETAARIQHVVTRLERLAAQLAREPAPGGSG